MMGDTLTGRGIPQTPKTTNITRDCTTWQRKACDFLSQSHLQLTIGASLFEIYRGKLCVLLNAQNPINCLKVNQIHISLFNWAKLMLFVIGDWERLAILKEIPGTTAYCKKKQESLKRMSANQQDIEKIEEILGYINDELDYLQGEEEHSQYQTLD